MSRLGSHRSLKESALEYGRGIAGGVMFSLPLLYTEEVWDLGLVISPRRLILYVLLTFGILMIYNRLVGLRRDASMKEVAIDSVEEIGIGLLLATLVLWMTGRFGNGLTEGGIIGMIVMEGMTVAIGVSVGTAQLGGEGEGGMAGDDGGSPGFIGQMAIAFCGAILFATNVAPTEEVRTIAIESPPGRLLLLGLAGILLAVLILRFSGFRGSDRHVMRDSWRTSFRDIVTTYAVALVAAIFSLYFFDQIAGAPLAVCVAQVVVLGVPAVIGASAGRLLLQTDNND